MKAGHDVSLSFFIACRFEEALKLYIQMTQRIRAAGEAALAKIFCWSGEMGDGTSSTKPTHLKQRRSLPTASNDYFLYSQERGGSSAALKRRSFSRRREGDIFVIGLWRAMVSRLGASIDALVSQTCRQSMSSTLGGNSAS